MAAVMQCGKLQKRWKGKKMPTLEEEEEEEEPLNPDIEVQHDEYIARTTFAE